MEFFGKASFVYFFIQIFNVLIVFAAAQECQTLSKKNGTCLPIKECSVIVKALETQGTTISLGVRRYLNRSLCYLNGKSVHICCPLEDTSDQQAIQFPRSEREEELIPLPPNCGQIPNNTLPDSQYASLYEYPWVALLEYSRGEEEKAHFCSGALINKRYVVTAAHCLRRLPENYILTGVRLGDWDTTTNPDCEGSECAPGYRYYNIESVHMHPEFENSGYISHDIALIRIAEDVEEFSKSVQPICLPILPAHQNVGYVSKSLETTGWKNVDSVSAQKQKGFMYVWSIENCISMYKTAQVQISSNQICGNGVLNGNYCNGDSGSPLMIQETFALHKSYLLAGIKSFGPAKCNENDWPNVYTRVGAYIEWIKDTITK